MSSRKFNRKSLNIINSKVDNSSTLKSVFSNEDLFQKRLNTDFYEDAGFFSGNQIRITTLSDDDDVVVTSPISDGNKKFFASNNSNNSKLVSFKQDEIED